MTRPVITVTKDTKLKRVVKLMGDNNIGSVVVVENDIPIGIFTERDLVKVVRKDFNVDELIVKEVMTSPIKKVGLESTVLDISKLMNKHHFRRVIVVDDLGRLAGIVTAQDLIKLMSY